MSSKLSSNPDLGSRSPDEIIRILLDTLESIYNICKLSWAETLSKGVENWKGIFEKKSPKSTKISRGKSRKPLEIISIT